MPGGKGDCRAEDEYDQPKYFNLQGIHYVPILNCAKIENARMQKPLYAGAIYFEITDSGK
jgi:hypothetical protein